MDYFYCPPDKITAGHITIDGEEFNHLVHVMRKKEGDHIRIIDGLGTAYDVQLKEITRRYARGTFTMVLRNHNEPSVAVTLAVGVLKNPSRFDFIIEKVTEIGVTEVIPLLTRRTIPEHPRIERWRKLALAGMKQCGRSVLPSVTDALQLDEFLTRSRPAGMKLIAHETVTQTETLSSLMREKFSAASILIGPEGGFDDEELARCIGAGYRPFSLGNRRLRTETAAIVASALVLCGFG